MPTEKEFLAKKAELNLKQDKLTAGDNITINPNTNVISATDTTYSDVTGATSQTAGVHGLVPAPAAGDESKFLKGDGTWDTVSAGSASLAGLTDVDLNNPTDGQALVYDATNQEWVNGEAGNADYVELTQQEYDALTPAQQMNGTMYFITDGQSSYGDAYFYPIIYSTNEREVGVWIDNKPLYCKTIDTGAIPSSTTKTVAHGIQNIDFLVTYNGVTFDDNGTDYRILPYVAFSNWSIGLYANTTNIYISTSQNWGNDFPNSYITLYYTKTTDTAGSGKYNTLGVPTVHYSTDEQIIGTWIDGSTLYEKTFDKTSQVISDNAWTNNLLGTAGSGIVIKSFEGYFGLQGYNACNMPYSYYRGQSEYFTSIITTDGDDISVRPNMNAGASVIAGRITIRYTKSQS